MFCIAGDVRAEDEEKTQGWFLTAELSSIVTAGNAESSTFGLTSTLRRVWEAAQLRIDGGGIRSEAALKSRTAVGTPTDFIVNETENREKTAENYYLRGKYEHNVTKRFALFGGADWLRNPFAGLDSRFLVAAGGSNIWANSDSRRFATRYSVTYTFEQEVVDNPIANTNFPGVRLGYDYFQTLTESTSVTADWNLDNTEDVRVIFNVALPIAISKKLAFKPSINLQWRNEPALIEVPLFTPGGTDTGTNVLTPLEELDMIFVAALVVDV
jgi:putative salt-induced outer membrane protein YdiY